MSGTRLVWWRSLRTRITLAVVAVSLLVSGVVGAVLAQRSADGAREALRAVTLGRLAVASDTYSNTNRVGSNVLTSADEVPPQLRPLVAETKVRSSYYDGEYMWASERMGSTVVLTVKTSAASLKAQDAERLQALAWAAIAAVLLSGVLGWAAGSALSRRLRRAAEAARLIADGDPGARAAQGGSDEVAILTRTVDDAVQALRRRVMVEQDFTADVAHELRTPLTGLVSAAELLPDDEVGRLVQLQVERLRRLVEDLLEVSRLDRGVESVQLHEVSLADVATETIVALPVDDVDVRVRVVNTAGVLIDRRRFDRVLGNLLVNLARHGGGRGELTVDGTVLVLTDHGPGYPDAVVQHGPQRFHGSGKTKGSGLGLTIVQKQAAVMGATVSFEHAAGGGARTVLRFAPSEPVPPGR